MDTLHEKYDHLKEILSGYGGLAIAFSSGVDSTFLLKTARDTLGVNVLAVTIRSCFVTDKECREAYEFCASEGIEHLILDADVLSIDGVKQNPKNRCYLCKREIFKNIIQAAQSHGISIVAEGTNADDLTDYRPGMQAIKELGVKSPLLEAGLSKSEIRALSKELGLPTWDKPSFACLASRIPYGDEITAEKLKMVAQAEEVLFGMGFRQLRVRVHGSIARIELLPEDFPRINEADIRRRICGAFKGLGFSYVTLDLEGYRTGSMNIDI